MRVTARQQQEDTFTRHLREMKMPAKRSILLLTDQLPVINFLKDQFQENVNVRFAGNWNDAVEELSSGLPDVFIADTSEPLEIGTHSTILNITTLKRIKAIMILHRNELLNIPGNPDSGAVQYFTKGIRPKSLWIMIHSLMKNEVSPIPGNYLKHMQSLAVANF